MRYLILITLLAGCGKQADLGRFQPYADRFKEEGAKRGVTVNLQSISFEVGKPEDFPPTTGGYTVAVCRHRDIGGNYIVVRSFLDPVLDSNDPEIESALFHEMGHCLLARNHRSDMENNRPVSLMYPMVVDGNLFTAHREEYLDELFQFAKLVPE